ncbi:MAG: hypothetical protein IKM25_02940 [Clostridia bacterium]|nr:hypothetical protein [Clostridia bacterium]
MFIVLRLIEPEKRYFKRRKQIKSVARLPAVICRETGSLPFCTVDVINGKNGIIWQNIEARCGRYASRIVAPRNIALPDGCNLQRFTPSAIISSLVFNTAKNTVSSAAPAPDSFVMTVTDRNALSVSRVCELLPLCSTVRVITSRPEKYACACEKALNDFGATLILRASYEPTRKPDIVICCDGVVCSSMNKAAVFAYKRRTCGNIRFCGNGINLTEKHKAFLPEGIEPLDFAGALTELCACSEYSDACFAELEISGNVCTDFSAEASVLCHTAGKKVL